MSVRRGLAVPFSCARFFLCLLLPSACYAGYTWYFIRQWYCEEEKVKKSFHLNWLQHGAFELMQKIWKNLQMLWSFFVMDWICHWHKSCLFVFTHCVFVLMILKISSCCCFLDIDDIEKHMPGLLKVIVIIIKWLYWQCFNHESDGDNVFYRLLLTGSRSTKYLLAVKKMNLPLMMKPKTRYGIDTL